MKPILCALCVLCGSILAADKFETRTTYAKAYGESKGNPTVDPAKDLPRYPAVEPKDAVATWKIKKGFKLELAAHEPQVRSPIAVSFDERGRMFVCEMIDYSEMREVTPHLGRVSMLEDKDGDGYYETSTVFADDLPWPTGLICANGGVYVIATPDIWFFKDTKGAGKADVREKVFTGFGTGLKILNVQGLANCPQWGQDNRIHIQAGGGNRGVVTCLKRPDLKGIELGGRDFWFDPRTYEFGLEAGGAQYGMSFDNYGRKFACSNSDHLQFFVYDDRYAARNPFFSMPSARQSIAADGGAAEVFRISPDEPWRIVRTRWRIAGVVKGVVEGGGRVSGYFTGATGTTVYRGDAYGDDFVNNTFTGDAGGQLVHRKKIYPNGVSLIGKRPEDEQNFEFAASRDTWVRVVNFANAPDGCLHVIDMYREVIEHPFSIPDEIKKHVDLNNGNNRGRIYRIVPDQGTGAPSPPRRGAKVGLGNATTAELVTTLGHPNGWHRDTAQRLLYEWQDKAAVPLLEKLFEGKATRSDGFQPSAPKGSDGRMPSLPDSSALARIHALGVLDGLGGLSEQGVIKAMADKDAQVRIRAVQLAERSFGDRPPTKELAIALGALAHDPVANVKFQFALAAPGFVQGRDPKDVEGGKADYLGDPMMINALVKLSEERDPWITSAIASAPAPLAVRLFSAMITTGENDSNDMLLSKLAAVAGAGATGKQMAIAVAALSEKPRSSELMRAFAAGLRRSGKSISEVDSKGKLAAVFAKAADTARDPKASGAARIEAINLVTLDAPPQAMPALMACLGKAQPDSVQAAAVAALGQFSAEDVTDAIITHWPDLRKKARAAAFATMLARTDRATALLHAIEAKKIAMSELTASDVQSLFKHKDQAVAALADKVLADLKPPSRESVIAKFQPALTAKGDAARGQVVFTQRCMACHKANNFGVDVAPPLLTVKTKGRDGIFTAILDPNKEVAPQYIAYTVNTKDGQTLAGIITNDNANSMTLKMMGGVEVNLPRSNIKGSSAAGLSLMPEGIEAGMTVQDMADLLDFIESLK